MKRKRSPSVARSFEEVRWVANLLDMLGLNASPQSVVAALHDGTRRNLFDMYIALGEYIHLYGDYDGGYYHNEDRVNRDRTKTLSIVEDDERALVLRTRVRAAHLSVEDDHVCVVETKSSKMEDIMHATARALQGYLPEPYASRLKNVQPSKRPMAEHVAEEAWKQLHRVFAAESDALERRIGRCALSQLMRVHGVRARMEMGGFSRCVWSLCDDFQMTTPQLVTFMSDCVATRVENEGYITALQLLHSTMSMNSFLTIASDCIISSRIQNVDFTNALTDERRFTRTHIRELARKFLKTR